MKKILTILAITVLAMEAGAEIKPLSVYSGHHINQVPHTTGSSKRCATPACDNFVGAGKVYCASCQEKLQKAQREREREVRELLAHGKDWEVQACAGGIKEICGCTLGEKYKLSGKMCFDQDGNLVVTNKLAKPFRQCDKVELKYSKNNLALYQITAFSAPDVKADAEMAKEEKLAMEKAVYERFKGMVTIYCSGQIQVPQTRGRQQLEVRAYKSEAAPKALRNNRNAGAKTGYIYSLRLHDSWVHEYVPEALKSEKPDSAGADAL